MLAKNLHKVTELLNEYKKLQSDMATHEAYPGKNTELKFLNSSIRISMDDALPFFKKEIEGMKDQLGLLGVVV